MHINTLELADSDIQAEGAKYLVEMLRANFTIQHLVCWTENLPLEGTSAFQVTFYLTFTVEYVIYCISICLTFRMCPTTIYSLQELSMWLKCCWTIFH